MSKNKRENNMVSKFFKLIKKLEFETQAGRINFGFGIVSLLIAVAITANDWIVNIAALATSAIKTAILKTNIIEPVEQVNILTLLVIILVFFVICIGLLILEDKHKKAVDGTIEDEK